MPNTYTQIHIQFVFAVKHRVALISQDWEERLLKYITGIFQSNNHKMIQINCMPDHIHILVGLRTHQSISSLIQNVKAESSKWINDQCFLKSKFSWQEGYGAFSYSKSDLPNVIRYIQNQKEHHKKENFLDEYTKFLKEFEIEYEDKYIFKEPE
ncbi:IS200/IS605 family transposase [Pedobacter sp. Leaf250]|uniref:IS200/IS605 family transposase n=1 Tax=Pedobacter sp. Leaf250 TaxID=2876559 RepID=UPI001E4285B4|nr:IS200/IS605 family transposase [Pedobacter sp. Leaf250]